MVSLAFFLSYSIFIMIKKLYFLALLGIMAGFTNPPQKTKLQAKVEALAEQVEAKTIEWRHHLHQNPELSNREFKTAEYIAAHLKSLGLEVQSNVAKTGVVAILKGGKPGPVVALRADIDGLPVDRKSVV